MVLRKSRLWAARDAYGVAASARQAHLNSRGTTVNHYDSNPSFRREGLVTASNLRNASNRLSAETRMAQDYYRKRKSSQN